VLAGKYRVKGVLGEGGVGIVVAATHLKLGRPVAIKLLFSNDREQVERLHREARAAARLRSEHAAKVLDVGRLENGAPFIVMELLEGEDLGEVVNRGPLPVEDAVEYLLQACEAIAEAHARGIVHRDLKPRNLFLTRRINGQPLVKVLDFGLAKAERGLANDLRLTQTATMMGSPHYMSPEQVRAARDVDARSDVWSLGVCLYELLTGGVPFDGPTLATVCASVLTDPPAPCRRFHPGIPEELAYVVERCLEKDPRMRYQNVAALAAALEPFASAHAHGTAERLGIVLRGPVVSDRPVGTDTVVGASLDPPGPAPAAWLAVAGAGAVAAFLAIGFAVGLYALSTPRPRSFAGPAAATVASVVPDLAAPNPVGAWPSAGDLAAPPPTGTTAKPPVPAAQAGPLLPVVKPAPARSTTSGTAGTPRAPDEPAAGPSAVDAGWNPSAKF
jgi:serine/threonine-protein kinase